MEEKVTKMNLEVDLQCEKCYKKVKKLLCKFPQIRDQKYNEKDNLVTITVVCCNPEKFRDKLYCKGCGCIKCIKIVPPTPPPPPPPPVCLCLVKIGVYCVRCYEGRPCGPCFCGCGGPPPCFDYGRPVCDSYRGGRPCYISRCGEYLYEENTSGCTIM